MTRYLAAALLAATTVLGSVLVSAATEQYGRDGTAALEVARAARMAARHAWRDAAREVRLAARQARAEFRRAAPVRTHSHTHTRTLAGSAAQPGRDRDRDGFQQASPTDDPCARSRRGDRGQACEVRDTRLPAPASPLTVDASPNGGILVEGWDEPDVLVRAVVQTYADTDAEAAQLLPGVRVTAAGANVSADGPERSPGERRGGWSVSFRIWAPRATALALSARNGGISVRAMRGESRFTTENGGVTLDDVSGQVVGTTRNGGVHVRLTGATWDGAGLDVETTNGGVTLAVPGGYSAALEVATVNGGIRSDLAAVPADRRGRQLRATLGSGGPLLKLRTVNGGVRINTR